MMDHRPNTAGVMCVMTVETVLSSRSSKRNQRDGGRGRSGEGVEGGFALPKPQEMAEAKRCRESDKGYIKHRCIWHPGCHHINKMWSHQKLDQKGKQGSIPTQLKKRKPRDR